MGNENDTLAQALAGTRGDAQKKIADAGKKVVETLLRKNQDYGQTAFAAPCLAPNLQAGQALRVRASDKIERLMNLAKNPKAEVAESFSDSVADLAGYLILMLAFEGESGSGPGLATSKLS